MTLLLKNVRILGGAREFPDPTDVFVAHDKISAIGSFPNKPADQVLDGQGAYLSPGFIDVDASSDHYLTLFDYPSQDDFLKQGVTTIFGGACGSSLAPLLYGNLESVRKWGGLEDRVNVNWHTVGEFLGTIDHHPLGVNFGTLAGHATVRRALIGDALRELTKNEMNILIVTLRQALREGAFGISTGLGYVHGKNTPYGELKKIADVVNEFHGIYSTHLRNSGVGVGAAVDETLKLAKETGVRTLISHFVPIIQARKEYQDALGRLEATAASGVDVHFDLYPFDTMILPIYTFLPDWAQNGGQQTMLANLKDEWLAKRVRKEMPWIDDEHCIVAQAPDNDPFVGKTLREVRDLWGLDDSRDALMRLMTETDLRGTMLYRNLDEDLIRHALTSPQSFVTSDAPSMSANLKRGKLFKSDRTTSTFPAFISLAEHGLLSLKEAVRKVTLAPAQAFGLTGRGEIKEENYADLTCFKNGEFKFTIVNGKVAMKDGEFQNVFAGKALRHQASS
jgi:N-acyl-D-aspartate/D-glutamate deacylase